VVVSMAALVFMGWMSRAKYSSKGTPRSTDQSMVALLVSYPPWRHHLGASLLQSISSPSLGSFRGNPRSRSLGSDYGGELRRSLPWGIIFGAGVGWRGSEVEKFASTTSTMARLGATRSWRWTWLDGLAQDDGDVRRRGGVNGKSCKIIAMNLSEDGFAKGDGGNFKSVCMGTR
jgi:hypothetical protein